MKIIESYGKVRNDRSFDRYFWQEQGPKAIFDAAYDLIQDYLLIRKDYADEPRLKRTVEPQKRAHSPQSAKALWRTGLASESENNKLPYGRSSPQLAAGSFNLFKKHNVKYLVVGGYAVMRYTEPRFTKDL